MEVCPCYSGKKFQDCCEPFLAGKKIPTKPEELMRSRYAAYSRADIDYIANTMRGPASLGFDPEQAKQWAKQIQWHELKVIRSITKNENEATVEFIARYAINGNADVIYEISEFHYDDGHWYYFDGVTPKVGRNDTCPCGSTKKFKKCCG